jgi:putative colanic acid biosynthesis UDP-glucose lipid carrier transferase
VILYTYAISFWYFASKITFLYEEFLARSLSKEIVAVIKTIVAQSAFMIIALFFGSRNPLGAKYFVSCFALLEFVIMPIAKWAARWYYATTYYKDKRQTHILIAGAGPLGMDFYKLISSNKEFNYKVDGFIDDEQKAFLNGLYLGKINDLDRILAEILKKS